MDGPFVLTYYNSKKEFKDFKKYVKELENYNPHFDNRKEIKSKIGNIVKQNFNNYINSIETNIKWHTKSFNIRRLNTYKDFILENIEIKIVDLMADISLNKEVVFYISQARQYITL